MELSVVIHATEDLDGVVEILQKFFGDIPIVVEVYEGHHGNPIYLATSYIDNCDYLLERLCNAFGGSIPASAGEGEGLYYLRLDKQALAVGEARAVNHDDVVRLKIRVRNGLCS